MLNRDELAALARAVVYVLAGAAILVAIGWWLSWWATGAIVIGGLAAAGLDAWRRPGWWRMW